MNILTRLQRAEARSSEDDFLLAAFDPVAGEDGETLWRHSGSKRVYPLAHLEAVQAENPGWVLWCKKPYDRASDPLILETPLGEMTDEDWAANEAAYARMEAEDALREANVVRIRLSIGNTVEGFDEEIVAAVKRDLGLD